jgi:hypothetical protein
MRGLLYISYWSIDLNSRRFSVNGVTDVASPFNGLTVACGKEKEWKQKAYI